MSVLQFVASLVRSGAWPAAVVGLAVIFRKPVAATLAGRLKRLKAGPGGVELEWEFAASVVRSEAERIGVQAGTEESTALNERLRELEQLARSAPAEVVRRCYQSVERELRSLTEPVDPEATQHFGAHGVAAIARKHGLISDATLKAVEGISVMHNLAAYGDDQLTPERAIEFAALTDAVLFAIRQESGKRS